MKKREFITDKDDVYENIETLKCYLSSVSEDQVFAKKLIGRGICFVVTEADGCAFFTPSRFLGYKCNTRSMHARHAEPGELRRHGGDTNRRLNEIFGFGPAPSESLDCEYKSFCGRHEVEITTAFRCRRKFWNLR
jgi:hypothetical protein